MGNQASVLTAIGLSLSEAVDTCVLDSLSLKQLLKYSFSI